MSKARLTLADVADEVRLRRLLDPRRTKAWGAAVLRNPPLDAVDTFEFFTGLTSGRRLQEVQNSLLTARPWSPLVQDDVPKRQTWTAVASAVRAGRHPARKTRAVHHDVRVDHARQLALLEAVRPLVEEKLTRVAVAYVRGRVMDDVVIEAVNTIRQRGLVYAAVLDIHACFDAVDWDVIDAALDRHLGKDVDAEVLALLKASYRVPVYRRDGSEVRRSKGVPQGAVLAPLLLNLYLADFDQIVQRAIAQEAGAVVWRYCDDLLVCAESVEALRRAIGIIKRELRRVRLAPKA